MGNYVSQNIAVLYSRRLWMKFNAENRAAKELDRQVTNPVVAPKFDAQVIDYHKLMNDSPEYLQSANKMDPNLAGRLKDVYVTSVDPLPLDKVPSRYDPNRPLPINRYTELFDMGYKESRVVPKGRVSLLQAIKFITDHRDNPDEYTIQRIAEENEIKPEVAADIIKHFRSFEVFIPGQTDKKALQEAVQKRLAATPNMKKLI